jgi:hypothetical protein
MLVMARNAEPSESRVALTSGFAIACSLLAALGCIELFSGHAGPGILSAIVVEIMLAGAFFMFAHREWI